MASIEGAQKAAGDAQKAASDFVDQGMTTAARGLSHSLAVAQVSIQDAYAHTVSFLDHAQEYVDQSFATAKAIEDTAVAGVKGAVAYAAANPYTAYSSATAVGLLAIPGTRRLLWRLTLGRLYTPANVIKKAETKVESVKAKLTDYTAQVQKLEERLLLGEEELKRGYSKLKATRNELQRLRYQVHDSQGIAEGVVRELRLLKQVDGSLALRGEAATQAAALKAHLGRINKGIYKIACRDI